MVDSFRHSPVIRMEGVQALSFVAIHPIECGLYFYRTKQMANWMKYWDDLQELNGNPAAQIKCTAPVSSLDDCRGFMESLMAHIFDGCRELELIVESQKFVIKKIWDAEGGFVMDYYIHNSHKWINQCRYGYIFRGMHIFQFLKMLHERMHSDNWNNFPHEHINY